MRFISFLLVSATVWFIAGCETLSSPFTHDERVYFSRTERASPEDILLLEQVLEAKKEHFLVRHRETYELQKERLDAGFADAEAFIANYQEGDELWKYHLPQEDEEDEIGLFILRDGVVVDSVNKQAFSPAVIHYYPKVESQLPDHVRETMFSGQY